ncbi:formate--tetrahydrofolate ligase, partial [Treponema sp. R6D11]
MAEIKKFAGSDIEIAQTVYPEHALRIDRIAEKAGIPDEYIEHYGKYKAKVDYNFLQKKQEGVPFKEGRLVLVTAITPTPAGEGKTTTTVGVADGLSRIGKKVMVALR